MYSVVLMMALIGGADAPALGGTYAEPAAKYGDHGHKEYRRRGCHGGGGCCGGGYYGGGGCCGGGYYGGCHGGGGCCGGYYGSMGGGYYGAMSYAGGYGYSSWGYPTYAGSMPIEGGYQYGRPLDAAERGYYGNNGSAAATIVVRLPADATLTVDDAATRSTGSLRTFVSPPLDSGKEYSYTLRAEEMRDGKKAVRKRDVKVRAGQTSEVNFDFADSSPQPRQ